MFYWIYDYPSSWIGVLFAIVFVGFTWLGIIVLRPLIRSWIHGKRSANDMVGFAFSGVSVLYGLLLGLLAVAAYQNYSSVSDVVDKEASTTAGFIGMREGFRSRPRATFRGSLAIYALCDRRGVAAATEGDRSYRRRGSRFCQRVNNL